MQAGRPIFDNCGSYDGWFQIDVDQQCKEGICFFPQVQARAELYAQYPNATWVLSTRPTENWIASVAGYDGSMGGDDSRAMRDRLTDCELPGLPAGSGGDDAELEAFYEGHTEEVRAFVAEHPSLTLVEFDLEAEDAGEKLRAATGIDASCWGHSNCVSSCAFWTELETIRAQKAERDAEAEVTAAAGAGHGAMKAEASRPPPRAVLAAPSGGE